MKDSFDASFDELLAKGFLEQVGPGPGGEPLYRLTAKAHDYFGKTELTEIIRQNSRGKSLERQARRN
jgi:chromosome segregation and condensation protein ScpB